MEKWLKDHIFKSFSLVQRCFQKPNRRNAARKGYEWDGQGLGLTRRILRLKIRRLGLTRCDLGLESDRKRDATLVCHTNAEQG